MRKSILVTALAGALGWANVGVAGPLLPSLSTDPLTGAFNGGNQYVCGAAGETCIAGEGAAPNIGTVDGTAKSTAVLHTDWIVMHVGGAGSKGVYRYFYQVENTSIFLVSVWQVGGVFSSFDAVSGKGLDLDSDADLAGLGGLGAAAGHTGANFTNLGDSTKLHDQDGTLGAPFTNPAVDETEKTGGALGVALSGIVNPSLCFFSSITCTFAPAPLFSIPIGSESSVIIAEGPRPVPVHWDSSGALGAVSTNWSSQNPNTNNSEGKNGEAGVKIVGPSPFVVPEPASILLLGGGLLGLGFWSRRRRLS